MKLKFFTFVLLAFLISSCGFDASKYYTPTAANASKAKISIEKLIAGRTAYIENCNECHRLYKPSKHNSADWTKFVNKMQERAKISDEQKKNIIAYLSAEIME